MTLHTLNSFITPLIQGISKTSKHSIISNSDYLSVIKAMSAKLVIEDNFSTQL